MKAAQLVLADSFVTNCRKKEKGQADSKDSGESKWLPGVVIYGD